MTPPRFRLHAPQRGADGLFYVLFHRPGCGGTASGATAEAATASAWQTVRDVLARDREREKKR